MKTTILILRLVCVVALATQLAPSRRAKAVSGTMGPAVAQVESKGELTLSDISKFEWVDKRCRMWAADGDIDVDQTCLVVNTAKGGVVVIPNEHNDVWLKEISDQRASADKWIQRFFAIGGGAKLR